MTMTKKDLNRNLNDNAKQNLILVAIILISLIIELFLSNYPYFSMKTSGCKEVNLDINSVECYGDAQVIDGMLVAQKGTVIFRNVDTEMKNLCIIADGTEAKYTRLDVSFSDDNFAGVGGLKNNYEVCNIFISPTVENVINRASYGKVCDLLLDFPQEDDEEPDPYIITSVSVNKMPSPGFNFVRFLIFILVGFMIIKKAWYGKANKAVENRIIIGLGAFLMVLVFLATYVMSAGDDSMLDKYPLEDPATGDQYEQLFDAFHNGRLTINTKVDMDVWNSLKNPYDVGERQAMEVDEDAWDRTYYNGSFYSYFGVAPVFVIYYPIYLLTGSLPKDGVASGIVTCLSIGFITLLYLELNKRYFEKISSFFVIGGYLAMEFGSLIFALCADRRFYFIAANFGISALAAFLAFLLKAYYADSFKKRIIWLILTSISIVMIAASRPSMLIYVLTAFVPLVLVMCDKNEKVKSKILYLCAAIIPAALGAVGIMAYNYARFGNPFEFGFNYQITVNVPSSNNIMPALLPAAIYHYYLQAPTITSYFPYLSSSVKSIYQYPRYVYLAKNIGAFFYPVTLGILGTPVLFTKKKNGMREYFIGTLLVCALLLSFIDMCKAGVHYRYVADIMLPLLIVGLVVIFDIMGKLKETENKKLVSLLNGIVTLLMIVTVIMGVLLIFANENKYLVLAPM